MSVSQARTERSVIVVDDEPLIRLGLADFFADEGYEVFDAENADQAIAILETNESISVVVTDVQMPGSMDGLKLARIVRDRWPPTVLIVVSGAANPAAGDLPSHAKFLRKPVDHQVIIGEIERLSKAV